MVVEALLFLFTVSSGTVVGVLFGAVPGLTGTVGVSLFLPLTFALPAEYGLLLLGGIYMGAMYGGAITAVLINVPGAPEAAFTAVEGFPFARRGEAQRALYYAIYACVLGGLAGVLVLLLLTPTLARLALKFGPPEVMLLAVAGLSIVGLLGGGNKCKAYFSVGLGLLISSIGLDPLGSKSRFIFGISALKSGVPVIVVVLGVFAVAEMLLNTGKQSGKIIDIPQKTVSRLAVLREYLHYKITSLRSMLLGVLIGILPGVGATIASFIAYGSAKATSKRPELFGSGCAEGIIANETANNAVVGSCLVPLLALGIPGSGTAAIMLGALTVHGIIPGPDLFLKHADVAYTFMYGMVATVLIMGVVGLFGVRYFSKIVHIQLRHLIPMTLVFAIVGAYSQSGSVSDAVLMLVFALLALVFRWASIPLTPMVLGVVLGGVLEENLRNSLVLAHAAGRNLLLFVVTRPISLIILAFLVGLIYLIQRLERKLTPQSSEAKS